MLGSVFQEVMNPLLKNNMVDVLEWSFDTSWGSVLSEWESDLLKYYANNNKLLGHGVTYSMLSVNQRHDDWCETLAQEMKKLNYTHITEHFGYLRAGSFHDSSPLPVPLTDKTFEIALDNIKRVNAVVGSPIGIENLAFAFSRKDAFNQGKFINKLIKAVPGSFILLDLHNCYCQMVNFGLTAEEILGMYDDNIDVRELHISGGSWGESAYPLERERIRRDTHNGQIPEEVFNLLEIVLRKYSTIRYVIFEQMPESLESDNEVKQCHKDYFRLRTIINNFEKNYAH